ncbi:hypothetical protein Y032_0015g2679 [Ancylostoma ceylanicum]|nr:hypothetical protein Y032_0015g2679 [Ancylostoma ceylanicum]
MLGSKKTWISLVLSKSWFHTNFLYYMRASVARQTHTCICGKFPEKTGPRVITKPVYTLIKNTTRPEIHASELRQGCDWKCTHVKRTHVA